MVTCCVTCCGVNHRNNHNNYSFHRFPMDPLVRNKWLRLIGRVGWNPTENSTVCSKHFLDQYKRKNQKNISLVKGALPTLFVPGQIKERVPSSYIFRDICPTSQVQEITLITKEQEAFHFAQEKRKLTLRIFKLKQKLREKHKKIRGLVAKTKRQAVKIVTLQDKLKDINSRPGLYDHYTMACDSEVIQNLIKSEE